MDSYLYTRIRRLGIMSRSSAAVLEPRLSTHQWAFRSRRTKVTTPNPFLTIKPKRVGTLGSIKYYRVHDKVACTCPTAQRRQRKTNGHLTTNPPRAQHPPGLPSTLTMLLILFILLVQLKPNGAQL